MTRNKKKIFSLSDELLKRRCGCAALALLCCFSFAALGEAFGARRQECLLRASAGQISSSILTNDFLGENSLSKTDWAIDDGISLKDRKIYFSPQAAVGARLLYRTSLQVNNEGDSFEINAAIGVNSLTGGRRFGIGFGFARSRYVVGDEGTSFAYVAPQEEPSGSVRYAAGICSYDENGAKTELATPVALNGSEYKLKVVGKYGGHAEFFVDGALVWSGTVTSGSVKGYFCFATDGQISENASADVYISDASADNDYYDQPENVNINDDFEDGSIDTSVWNLYNDAPYLKGVAETDGMLRFIDSNRSTVTTKYRYSNFEMSFDLPYVKRTTEYRSDGALKSPVSSWIGVFCAIDADDYTACTNVDRLITDYDSYFLSFTCNAVNGVSSGTSYAYFGPSSSRRSYPLPENYNLWSADNEGRNFNVMFSGIDGVFNLDVKWGDETEWYHVFTEKYGMAGGYISLAGYGTGNTDSQYKANFAFDNVKITNRDYDGKVLSGIGTDSKNLPDNGDYGYFDSKSPAQLLADGTDFDEQKGGSGCKGALAGADGAIVAAAAFAALFGKRRKNG